MSINLDNLGQAGQAGGRADRRHPGARQDRWLLELEQAMFAQARSKRVPGKVAENTGGSQPSKPLAQVAALADPQPAHQTTTAAATTIAAHGGGAGALLSGAATPVLAPPLASADPDSSVGPVPAFEHGVVAAAEAPMAEQASERAQMRSVALTAGGKDTVSGLAGCPPRSYGGPAAWPDGGADGGMLRPAERVAGILAGWPAALERASEQELPPPLEMVGEEPAPQGAPEGDEEEYSLRNMHLYREGEDVQAWVRDSTVRPEQAPGLALVVAAALAGEGAQLRALTLNGKPVALREARPGHEENSFAESLAASGAAYNVKGRN